MSSKPTVKKTRQEVLDEDAKWLMLDRVPEDGMRLTLRGWHAIASPKEIGEAIEKAKKIKARNY